MWSNGTAGRDDPVSLRELNSIEHPRASPISQATTTPQQQATLPGYEVTSLPFPEVRIVS